MTAPAERAFAIYPRGAMREEILRDFRIALRARTDPATGVAFTEDTIRRVTMRGSRFYAEADAIDLVLLGVQARDSYMAQQLRPSRSSHDWLVGFHGQRWGETPLPASGGSGTVLALANAGVAWAGSTTVPDPLAVTGTDPAGNRYQVFVGGVTPGSGEISLTLQAIDGGEATNIEAGTVVTWTNPPVGAQPTATVTADFSGGLEAETDADFARRLDDRIAHPPGGGNWSQVRGWARASARNAVDDAFVYCAALNAGSVLVAVTQKRGTTLGPLARVPSVGTLGLVTVRLTPPGSPDMPGRVRVLVTSVTPEPCDAVLRLTQRRASTQGWADATPWPIYSAGYPTGVAITAVNVGGDPLVFDVETDEALPTGVTAPSLMVWDEDTSSFEALLVSSVASPGGDTRRVTLLSAPTTTLAVGQLVSPDMARRALVAGAVTDYFDELGPGEVINLLTDPRAGDAYRRPEPTETRPYAAGIALVSRVSEALGAQLADASIASMSPTTPTVPADVADGPALLVAGRFAVYA